MSSSGKEPEDQLTEAGNKLLQPPSSVDELLSLLGQVESFLSRVEQSPSKSMLTALSPSMKALVADELIRHSDADVKAAVASCISEITRITAPDAPYDDDKMKDVFQLIVSTFENLSDESSRSYNRRAMILETVAKVRSCVVMLDLECDGLIIEMFQHFLKSIRDYHPENVFSSMVAIMTLVLDESEDISLELLRPILASLKIDTKEAQSISRKLGEKVFENCAVQLKPYLSQAVKYLGIALNDYSEVVASICKAGSDGVEHNDANIHGEHSADESKIAMTSSEQEPQLQPEESKLIAASADDTLLSRESAKEEGCPEGVDPSFDKSPKVMSNGGTTTCDDKNLMDLESLKKTENNEITTEPTVTNDAAKAPELLNKTENDDLAMESTVTNDEEKAPELLKKKENDDLTMESTVKNEEAKATELLKKTENNDLTMESTVTNEAPKAPEPLEKTGNDDLTMESTVIKKEIKAATDSSDAKKSVMSVSELEQSGKKRGRKPKSSTNLKEPSVCTHVESQKDVEKQLDRQDSRKDAHSSPIEHPPTEASVSAESEKESEGVTVSPPCPTDRGLPDESQSKKAGSRPMKENKFHEDSPHAAGSKKSSEGTVKQLEKALGGANDDKKVPHAEDIPKDEDVTASDSEAKQPTQLRENMGSNSKGESRSLLKKEDGKSRRLGKTSLKKDVTESTKDEAKVFLSSRKSSTKSVKKKGRSEEVSKINSRGKHTPHQDRETENITYDENLIGLKVKVWWPDDRRFYEGEITYFDPIKKKHKVSYVDGDIEILNLKEEKWEFIKDFSSPDWEEEIQQQSLDTSPEMPRRKKAKTDSESSLKGGKIKALPTRRENASSSKSKGLASRSGHRLSNEAKVDGKSKDKTSDSDDEKEDATPGKKGQSQKARGKSKDVDSGVLRTIKSKREILQGSTKSKQDSPKTIEKPKQDTPQSDTKSKGKSPPSGSKSNANGTEKVKTSSSRVKGAVEVKEKSQESAKNLETSKRKSTDLLRTAESEAKNGNKRLRGVKN